MEKKFMSVEDFAISAQDFSIKRRFLITNVVKKMASNGTKYYFLTLKDNTGKLNAKRFTNGEIEFRSLNSIYLIGNFIEIEGIYQYRWQSMKIFTENKNKMKFIIILERCLLEFKMKVWRISLKKN